MNSKLKTIILRFRDLVTEEDETISKHKKIIEEKGFVWWAWWKKGTELTPTAEFGNLSMYANEEPIIIYLLDSGQGKLYKAKCHDIKSYRIQPNNSPDVDCTPEYYKDRKYFAWFKFSSIDECEDTEINKFSYLGYDSLFKDGTRDYSLFFNKKVFSVAELIQQNRTVWLLREFENGDKENEVILLNTNVLQPSLYSQKYFELKGNTFLWLSDLHFSNNVINVKPTEGGSSLTELIKSCDEELFKDISAMIISGDITNRCTEEGFNLAQKFISDFNRENNHILDSDNIIICPGNHDLKRMNCNCEDGDYKLFSDNIETYNLYSKFFKTIYHIAPNKFLTCGRKFLTLSGRTIEIASLNSIMLQQYEDFEGHGYISSAQLELVEKSMGWDKNNNSSSYRIVVMHHHYLPACLSEKIEKKPSSVVYDADRLMQWLIKNNVKLLLHGHKHNKFFAKVSYPKKTISNEISCDSMHDVYVISAGGVGAENTDHTFATIKFDVDNIIICIYKIYTDNIAENKCIQTISIPIK